MTTGACRSLLRIAFSIWFPIYLLLIASSIYAITQPVPMRTALLVAAAEVLTAAWVPLFLANTRATLVSASIVLAAAAASAVGAVFTSSMPWTASPWPCLVFVSGSFGLFAGWLCCAAVLGVGIALQAYGVETPQWLLLGLSILVAALTLASRNPILALPCAWALVWQEEWSLANAAGVLACIGLGRDGTAGATKRCCMSRPSRSKMQRCPKKNWSHALKLLTSYYE